MSTRTVVRGCVQWGLYPKPMKPWAGFCCCTSQTALRSTFCARKSSCVCRHRLTPGTPLASSPQLKLASLIGGSRAGSVASILASLSAQSAGLPELRVTATTSPSGGELRERHHLAENGVTQKLTTALSQLPHKVALVCGSFLSLITPTPLNAPFQPAWTIWISPNASAQHSPTRVILKAT